MISYEENGNYIEANEHMTQKELFAEYWEKYIKKVIYCDNENYDR